MNNTDDVIEAFLKLFSIWIIFWILGMGLLIFITRISLLRDKKKQKSNKEKPTKSKQRNILISLTEIKEFASLDYAVSFLLLFMMWNVTERGLFFMHEVILLALGFVKTYFLPFARIFLAEETKIAKFSVNTFMLLILALVADSKYIFQSFIREPSQAFSEIASVTIALIMYELINTLFLNLLPDKITKGNATQLNRYYTESFQGLGKWKLAGFVLIQLIPILPFIIIPFVSEELIPNWVKISLVVTSILSLLFVPLPLYNLQKLSNVKNRSIVRLFERTFTGLQLFFSILLLLYGFGVVYRLGEIFNSYLPQITKGLSQILSMIISGIIGNYAHSFFENMRLRILKGTGSKSHKRFQDRPDDKN